MLVITFRDTIPIERAQNELSFDTSIKICICNSSECWTMSQFSSQHITLLLTLMCVCVCASVTVCVFVRNSVYRVKLEYV